MPNRRFVMQGFLGLGSVLGLATPWGDAAAAIPSDWVRDEITASPDVAATLTGSALVRSETLRHIQALIDLTVAAQPPMVDQRLEAQLRAEIDQRTNHLLGFMLDHFDGPISPARVQLILNNSTRAVAPVSFDDIADSEVPLYVMRRMTMLNHVPGLLRASPQWPRFVARYAEVLLAA